MHTDKREVAQVFRERLNMLIDQRRQTFSAFANSVGVDRSALSQFLAEDSARLPRAETLHSIAATCGVSLDWLLGLIAPDKTGEENVAMVEIENATQKNHAALLSKWHREATGYKIRYIPAGLPDLLRTKSVGDLEFDKYGHDEISARQEQATEQLNYSRKPETDMEVCMPMQTLELFAEARGKWQGIEIDVRKEQLATMAELIDEMYPTFRLFLYDNREMNASPYTVFGPKRAAIYVGNMYLVVNSAEHIKFFARHFDGLIRIAKIGPDRSAEYIRTILKSM